VTGRLGDLVTRGLGEKETRRGVPDYLSSQPASGLMIRISVPNGSITGQDRMGGYINWLEGAEPSPPIENPV